MKRLSTTLTGIILLALLATTATAVDIETVPVGNPGNANDDTGYGSVAEAYRIGTYEVTAGQYTEFLNAVAGVDAFGLYNGNMWSCDYGCKIERYDGSGIAGAPYQYRVPDANRANRPVNYVSWGDAARFSNWLHNGQPTGVQDDSTTEDGAYNLNGATSQKALMAITRESDATWVIPTENEWHKAAYHKNDGVTGNYFDYPTSSDSVPGRDMTEATNPGNNANYNSGNDPIESPFYRTEVGEFENSESPYDTFDQGGNLWEWNETEVVTDSSRGVRGGYWSSRSNGLAASNRHNLTPTYEFSYVGFRVASVPEPGTITLLLCAMASMALMRRR